MSDPSPQLKYFCTNAVKQAHLNVHRSLDALNQGSEKEAKRLIGQAIKQLTEALVNL